MTAQALSLAIRGSCSAVAATYLAEGKDTFIDAGADPLDEHTPFELGSLGKTFTSLLLADLHGAGLVDMHRTVGYYLGLQAGVAGPICLSALATHRAGLPRLPPLLAADGVDQADPYASFSRADLMDALRDIRIGQPAYSNFGYQLLGVALETAVGEPLDNLVRKRIFEPLDMTHSGPNDSHEPRLPGYEFDRAVSRWHSQLNGDGGWESSIGDMRNYLEAHIWPPDHSIGAAIRSSLQFVCGGPVYQSLGWGRVDDIFAHDGATGGFSSYMAFSCIRKKGLVVLTNNGNAEISGIALDRLK